MRVRRETESLMNNYVRKRNNRGRNDTRARALIFAVYLESIGVKSLGQAGKSHVIRYWKTNNHRSDNTLKNHYYAVKKLWELNGNASKPPVPRYKKM